MGWVVTAWRTDRIAAQLEALERLGVELREDVRRFHAEPAPVPTRRRRRGRASLRDSGLAEMMRASAGR